MAARVEAGQAVETSPLRLGVEAGLVRHPKGVRIQTERIRPLVVERSDEVFIPGKLPEGTGRAPLAQRVEICPRIGRGASVLVKAAHDAAQRFSCFVESGQLHEALELLPGLVGARVPAVKGFAERFLERFDGALLVQDAEAGFDLREKELFSQEARAKGVDGRDRRAWKLRQEAPELRIAGDRRVDSLSHLRGRFLRERHHEQPIEITRGPIPELAEDASHQDGGLSGARSRSNQDVPSLDPDRGALRVGPRPVEKRCHAVSSGAAGEIASIPSEAARRRGSFPGRYRQTGPKSHRSQGNRESRSKGRGSIQPRAIVAA